jgi:MFS family permease
MYLLTQIIFSFSGMATGLLVVYTAKTWSLPDAQASGFTITLQVGLTLANLFFGFLADRKRHILSLEICMALSTLSLVLAIIAPSPLWFFPTFFLRGAVKAGTFITGISIVYECTSVENHPICIGLANTISWVAGGIAPLISGWLVGPINYRVIFILSTIFGVISWVLLRFAVREPRKTGSAKGLAVPVSANPKNRIQILLISGIMQAKLSDLPRGSVLKKMDILKRNVGLRKVGESRFMTKTSNAGNLTRSHSDYAMLFFVYSPQGLAFTYEPFKSLN